MGCAGLYPFAKIAARINARNIAVLVQQLMLDQLRADMSLTSTYLTRSSAVAKRPRDASCLYSFYTLEWCGYPMVKKIEHMFIRFDMIHVREKNCRFHVPQPTFLFPLETPL